ncbi:MAG: aliphatic sulfonate ABC transporter substrate-binding protein [Candidatus Nanopelagicales bacterium]|nr:aliphatic sulfonate ABC transporter substrate-binding protein [Candidatus Nanopelagicales bacterium]
MNRTSTAIAAITGITFAGTLLTGCVSGEGSESATQGGQTISLDYAYWNPLSLVVRNQQCVEKALGEESTVNWVLSAGSNKANENLNAEVIDIGSTAGVASFVARANGAAIKTIGVFSQPEWAAIVVPANSPITGVSQLNGSKIAATKGTDPYFFLLQTLNEAGLSESDVEIINLQHSDGQAALARGDVDAWAGLDPIMATTEVKDGAQLIYRNIDFNSYGVLNAREAFLSEQPELVDTVLNCYEEAREWIIENPADAATLLANEASLDPDIASKVLTERTVVDLSLVPGETQRQVLETILPTLIAEGQVRSEEEARAALETLYDSSFAERATS